MKISAKNFTRLFGAIASAVAIGVFLYLLADSVDALRGLGTRSWLTFLVVVLIYLTAYIPMTLAWVWLSRGVGAHASARSLAQILLVSQIGKYIPGNFAHFLGRAFLAKRVGVPLNMSGQAIFLELAGVLVAGGLLAGTALGFGIVDGFGEQNRPVLLLSGISGFMAVTGAVWVISARVGNPSKLISSLAAATLLYVGMFGLLAVCNVILVAELGASTSTEVAVDVAAAFMISWLIGFVTPGSPAGLGLRELTFVGLLVGTIPQQILVLSASAFRMATFVGDVVAWLVGIAIRPDSHQENADMNPV